MPKPQTPAPALEVDLVGGGRWHLADQHPDAFTLVVFYRGLHCPVCKVYTAQLAGMLDAFAGVGVTSVVAVSGDTEARATTSVQEWGLGSLDVGWGQSVASMRAWGLFVSKGITEGEPDLFGEPGLFLVKPEGSIYAEVLNSVPFGRPHLDEIVKAVTFVQEKNYPARGEA